MNEAKPPLVSVIIPTWNRAKIVTERTIRSVLAQTYQNIECILVDDGSTDDTEARVTAMAQADPRLKYFKKKNGGQGAARNYGVRQAQGEYIAFTDDDDEFLPGYMEVAMEHYRALPPEVSYISSGAIIRDLDGRESYYLPEIEPFWKFSIGNGWVFRRHVFFDHQLFFHEDRVGFDDLDLLIRFHLAGQKGFVFPEALRVYYTAIGTKKFSASKNYDQQCKDFEVFFAMDKEIYRAAGADAYAWICRFGGTLYCQNGNLKRGRALLWESFHAQAQLITAFYLFISYLGRRGFLYADYIKSRIMRVLRSGFMNRLAPQPK